MSVRVDTVEIDVSSRRGRSIRPVGWRWWGRRRARQELAAREATELLNEFGKDAYWLACICMRRSRGALKRHWHAVATELEQRTGRKSPAMPATGRTAGSLRAPPDQHLAPRSAALPRHDAYRAGASDDLHDEHSQSHGRYHRASQIAVKEFDRYRGDRAGSAGAAQAERDRGDNSEHGVAMGPRHEETYDDPPRKSRRGGLIAALALVGCATVGTAGTYAYWTYNFAPGSAQTSATPSQAKPAQPAVRDAPPATTANAAVARYTVQVSARRSKAEAQASFRALQAKFPRQLGDRTANIRRTDLGAKGIYYRAMVGPFASAGEADQFCTSLKAAGGQCIIQRN